MVIDVMYEQQIKFCSVLFIKSDKLIFTAIKHVNENMLQIFEKVRKKTE